MTPRNHAAKSARRMRKSQRSLAGLTLLEVMVALVILSLGMTALFSSEVGAIKAAERAWKMDVATLLARCKMGEVEAQIAEEGLPAIESRGRDKCCEDAEFEGFRCEWEVVRIVLPDLEGDALTEGGDANDPLANLTQQITGGGEDDEDGNAGGTPTVDSVMQQGVSDDALAGIAMSYAFPIIKPGIEERVRRANVQVFWKEGKVEEDFTLSRFIVSETPGPTLGGDGSTGAGGRF